MVVSVKKTVYQTADGQVFTDLKAARDHELRMLLGEVGDQEGWGRGGDWSSDMFITSLMNNKHKIAEIFHPYLLPKARAHRDD